MARITLRTLVGLIVAGAGIIFVSPGLAQSPSVAAPAKPAEETESASESDSTTKVEDLEFLPADDETVAEIDELIPQLASRDHMTREDATARLIGLGALVFPQLREAYLDTDDFEVQLRVGQIVHQGYLDYYVYHEKGFLGVGINALSPNIDLPPGLGEDVDAVMLTQIHDGSAAQRAGLKRRDIVIAMDGVPLEPADKLDPGLPASDAQRMVTGFSRRIAGHRPGDTLTLTLFRGVERMDVEITLGRCPADLAKTGRVQAVNKALIEAEGRFGAWWDAYFAEGATGTTASGSNRGEDR